MSAALVSAFVNFSMSLDSYPLVQSGRLLLQQQVLVRDGSCKLAADVWLPPADPYGDGPWPTVLCACAPKEFFMFRSSLHCDWLR